MVVFRGLVETTPTVVDWNLHALNKPVGTPRPERNIAVTQTHAAPGTFITIAQAADYLGVNPATIRLMIADGRLKAYSLGHRVVRLRVSEIDAALRPYGGGAQ
ncbi:MAG: hypothetical protein QG597_3932 [Actinomycetota bacterium]|nr:hypothetical protein [Actinomycetota bacterium]